LQIKFLININKR